MRKGETMSEEQKAKIGASNRKAPNPCVICGSPAARFPSGRQSPKCGSLSCSERHKTGFQRGHKLGVGKKYLLGRKDSEETRKRKSLAAFGKVVSETTRLKQSFARRGEKSRFWKGGITPMNKIARESIEYKLWRESVFRRDDWTCQICFSRGGRLNADHIKPFALFPDLRLNLENGRTLCFHCHKKTDTYGGRTLKYA